MKSAAFCRKPPRTIRKTKEIIRRAPKFARAFRVDDGDKFRLKDFKPHDTLGLKDEHKPRAKEALANGV
jgi:hypothetical protein